ncbi:hypothetical protein M427DRAFT_135860 [Gonapodya prolifera JEL478]|uniref:Uncharacterized protein n=1 Tax=Gonapodya prolifera (strain JEL478) TaxID=1344416 RepID=A0A139ACD9_GONPJ|nr:hypothetical protein M427DRAFT_135860 [Gonapodya prolifera JEL478]|eukprot:KXS14244.1 hypothetical protein M427DRAFT_135860 [Gonapodya prolifera JEL478]
MSPAMIGGVVAAGVVLVVAAVGLVAWKRARKPTKRTERNVVDGFNENLPYAPVAKYFQRIPSPAPSMPQTPVDANPSPGSPRTTFPYFGHSGSSRDRDRPVSTALSDTTRRTSISSDGAPFVFPGSPVLSAQPTPRRIVPEMSEVGKGRTKRPWEMWRKS